MDCPTHANGMKRCVTMTATAIHTIELPEGHFACVVFDRDASEIGAVCILDRDEVEAHIIFLRNAMEDAERLDAGLAPLHSAPTLTRQ